MSEQQWTDHPRLRAWLREQEAGFEGWAASHPGTWDFSPGSLDGLEAVVRAQFSSWEEARAAQRTAQVTVPAWYFGEVCVRAGAVWKVNPSAVPDPEWEGPFVGVPGDPMEDPDHEDLYEDDDYLPAAVPVAELRDIFLKDPPWRLRSIVEEFEAWRRGSTDSG
ncbi:hypothetical protein RKE30_09685 [Streptomyces sp. Li-HN-5-11]|uniref:hypothetical protein n=1 Tax=Streptomyces sp. Li-HN-5-11 TaxID=3075432 RepID=UPI0028B1F296|nr:hypothetical protein [Streptomyces sp. Li-HN-5-11]WNM30658.1 hypothetical protein RKE30_09685 [Streptomyces sp. Li-HN-5-11]